MVVRCQNRRDDNRPRAGDIGYDEAMSSSTITRYPPYVALEQAMIRTFEVMKTKGLLLYDFHISKADTWAAIWVFFVNDEDVPKHSDVEALQELERDFRERLMASKEQFSFQEAPPISFEYDSKENIDKNYQGSLYLRLR